MKFKKHPVNKAAFQLQNNVIFEMLHCAFLHSITSIVGMSIRAPKLFTFGTYYNIIDTYIK